MIPLTDKAFPDFFRALHGCDPFPWQSRLATQVLETGWPSIIAMPTGSGKTACIDVAIFILASEAGTDEPRWQGRRIFFVIDRRIVVDEAYSRATQIAARLAEAKDGLLAQIADRLRLLAGPNEMPLATAILRGGIYHDEHWAKSPCQPMVVVGTVDQVGSRLLHRGYGLSPYTWPIHAGLIGNDSLIIVDEAHCSRPFAQTLDWINRYQGSQWIEKPLDLPFNVVAMSATPPTKALEADSPPARCPDVFKILPEDLAHPVLGRRLTVSKPTRLAIATPKEEGFISTTVENAVELAKDGALVGVLVNRVATARAIFKAIRQRTTGTGGNKIDVDVILLTGRVRPADRDILLAAHDGRIMAKPDRIRPTRAMVVVATQCLEVGADVDFDALVTECCSFDALRQRFGRLNRLGSADSSPGMVIIRPDQTGSSDDDPIYGPALTQTWKWLDEHAAGEGLDRTVDLGILSIENLLDGGPDARVDVLRRTSREQPEGPMILPSHCDCWVQTSPTPHADPDPSIYLHGPKMGTPDVQVVWRADINQLNTPSWIKTVASCNPTSAETITMPLYAVRAWLDHAISPVADLEGMAEPKENEKPESGSRACLRWHGPDSDDTEVMTDPKKLQPGDILVVPASYGGCDAFGWAPEIETPVTDLGDQMQANRRRAIIRIHASLVPGWGLANEDLAREIMDLASMAPNDDLIEDEQIRALLAQIANDHGAKPWLRLVASHLSCSRPLRISQHPGGTGLIVSTPTRLPMPGCSDRASEDTEIGLDSHLKQVGELAERFARLSGLTDKIASDCGLAARLHDVGKLDPRFQIWLHDGNHLAYARSTEPLAKSKSSTHARKDIEAARSKAAYPKRGRHELASVRLAETATQALARATDRELVLHLIGSHHGRCRPFAPVIIDEAPVNIMFPAEGTQASSATGLGRLDAGVPERFWRLVRRYGWWGLSFLETIVRLADCHVSEMEQQEESE
jgi:CRISPR-associated endonuclease/helicase Cas3